MDFSEDFEVSTPCLIVQSSQNETSQRICQSDSDPFFLKQLNISRSPNTSKVSSLDDKTPDTDKSKSRIVEYSIEAKQFGIMRGAGSEDGKNQDKCKQGGNNNNESSGVRRHAQTCPVQGAGGGGGGAGGDDGDGNRDSSHHEPSSCDDDTSHSEPATSSSDSLPDLIKPSEADARTNQSDTSLSTSASAPEETISQASTAIVGEGPTVPSLAKKSSSSSSSSSGGYRSDLSSSSAYQGSISSSGTSSMSSASLGVTSGSHYPLPRVMRTQSEMDTSSSTSASSEGRGGPGNQKSHGFTQLESIDENVDKQDHSTSDSSKDHEQECSSQEDLFGYNKEDSTVISSQEVSRLSTPQDRSTPVDQKLSQNKSSGGASSLHRQVVSIQTSTPVESNQDIQQTPPSQNITPNQSFHCFHFSGEEGKESSESSSFGMVKTSPEALTGVPVIIPSSPTSPTRSKQSSSSSSHSSSQNISSKSAKSKENESSGSSLDQLPPSPSSFRYPWRQDSLLPSPEEEINNEQEQKQKGNSDNDDEEFIGLPRWQKELIQKNKKEHPVSSKSSSSTASSSSSSSGKEQQSYSAHHDFQHSWQSEMPSTAEGSKSSCLKHDSRSSEVKRVTFLMDVSESESPKETQAKSTSIENRRPQSMEINPSLSPSSIDGQKALVKDDVWSDKEPTFTQPEMSEDLFRPLLFSTQESTQDQDKSLRHDANAPGVQIEEAEEPDVDSQSVAFDLHLSQSSQPDDMDSPPLIPEPSSPSGPSTTFTTVMPRKDEDGSGSSPEPPSTSTPTAPTTTASTDVICEVILPLSSLLKNEDSHTVGTPSQSILEPVAKDTEGDYRSLEQHGATEDFAASKASENRAISKPLPADEVHDIPDKSHDRVPPLSSETSSDSITGLGFHFSLPTSTEPLRPVTCTTPPPMRSRQTAVPTTVCETPGIFSQEPSNVTVTTKTKNQTTPSLTFSMPRQSESESEIFFNMQGPHASSSSSSTTDPLEASRTLEQSVFAQVRDETSSSRRREKHEDEYNPFEFTSQDDVAKRPPISRRKSRKRGLEASREQSTSGSSRDSDQQSSKIIRIDSSREQNVDDKIRIPEGKMVDSGQSSAASADDSSVQRFHRVTKTKIVKKITTEVVKHITIITTKGGQENEEIVDEISYVEEENPKIERVEDYETDEVDFIQRDDSICEIVRPPAPPPPPISIEITRKSPRGKKRANENKEESNSGISKRQKTSSDPGEEANEVTPEADGKAKADKSSESKKKDTPKEEDGVNFPPLLRRESTEKVVEAKAGSSRTPEPALELAPGTRVFAHWSDNHFYPGILTSGASKSGFYNVSFDDGDKRKVRAERLVLRDSLHSGQHVLAQDADGYYDPGVVVGHYRYGDENGYEIKDKKGKIKRYPSRNVILTEEQAATILSSSSSLSRTTSSSSASTGRQNTKTRSTDLSTSRSSSLSVNTSRDTSAKDTSCGSSITSPSTVKVTEPTDETPKSSRKKSFKKNRKQPSSWRGNQNLESSSEASSDERSKRTRGKRGARRELGKILPTRTSPRKQKQTAKEKAKDDQDAEMSALGPLPSNDSLFAGFAFLITGCHNAKEKESKNDSPDSESEFVEFSREHLVRQIEAGGGVVLKDFEETQISGADQCFLVSSSHQRTRKFFQCLAYDIPIVHHSWVHDSSILDELRDYKKYLLPAGTSLETGEVMECRAQPKPKVLQGLKIYLHGDQSFRNTWSSIILAAGSSVVAKLPNRPGRAAQLDDFDNMTCDVIISGTNTLPASIRHTVEMLGIPVVALEWLFQCLINGFLVPYDGHPKYDYKNIQKDDNL